MGDVTPDPRRRLLRLASVLVPRRRRASWLRQWAAELEHRRRTLERRDRSPGALTELRWTLGSVRHALWLRGRACSPDGAWTRDLRFAVRSLRRAPRFTLLGAGVLAVGIAANAAIFSVVDAALLEPLPYPDSDRVVLVWQLNHEWIESGDPFLADFGRTFPVSYPLYEHWRDATDEIFTDVAAYKTERVALQGPEHAERIWSVGLAGNALGILEVEPLLGRPLVADDDRSGADRVVLLGHGLWRRQFGADPEIIGGAVVIDGVEHVVIGVMPAGFAFPYGRSELWTNLADSARAGGWDSQGLGTVARLRPGVELETARARMRAVTEGLLAEMPDLGDVGVRVTPLLEEITADIRPSLFMLLGAVGLVLLIACANVANLTLVRGVARQRELALRAALGAGRVQLLRQLVAESLTLALLGALAAVPLTLWAVGPLGTLLPAAPRFEAIGVDLTVLGYSAALAALSGVAVGVLPALRLLRRDPGTGLHDGPRGTGGRARGRALSALVVAEVALAVVLLVAAGLLLTSFERLAAVEHGFDAEGLLTVGVDLPERRYPEAGHLREFIASLTRRVDGLPGAEGAAMTSSLAFSGSESSTTVVADVGDDTGHDVRQEQVTPGYFATMGIPVLRGREFEAADHADGSPVAVVNETLARSFWPGRDPLGQRLRKSSAGSAWAAVVGVVGDARHKSLDRGIRPVVYFPLAQRPDRQLALVVRAGSDPGSLLPAVRSALAEIDPAVPAADPRTMRERIAASTAEPRLRTVLVSGMAAVAAILAVLGVYGVIAYAVQARVREIGVRMALGAARRQVVASVLRRGALLAVTGSLLGVAAAAILARFLGSFLYGLTPWNPLTYAAGALLLIAAACLASWLPARRAARIDPLVALRTD